MIYLDHAATTPLRPEAAAAMRPFLEGAFGNTSGSHGVSRRVKNALEEARERAAALIGAQPTEIVFTGGGTEADTLALLGPALNAGGRRGVVTVATEHEAVLETTSFLAKLGCPTNVAGVDRFGVVDPEQLADLVNTDTAVVSVMTVNNETGTIQPVADVVETVKGANPATLVHTDAIQAYPAVDLGVGRLGVDLLSLGAHKFGGPQGVGLLYVRSGVGLEPVLHGGGQELGRRSGTHNVAGILGMVAAMEAAADRASYVATVTEARRRFEAKLSDRAERTVPDDLTSPQHCHLRLPVEADTMLVRLDRLGLAASAGSACSSGAATVSHVLTAMGLEATEARHSLRFSFGWTSRPAEAEEAAELVLKALEGRS
ncbi:MAG: cysteine desulfurase family protein [Actinomycetota bacterium]